MSILGVVFYHPYGFIAVGNYPKQIKFWDSTTIIDHKMVIWVSNNNKKLFKGKDVWCTPDVAKWARNFDLLGKWHAILEPKIKFSSGHQAVQNMAIIRNFTLFQPMGKYLK